MSNRTFPSTFLISILVCAGCASTPKTNPKYDAELEAWMGRPLDKLVSTWGVPQGERKLSSGATVVTYQRSGAYVAPGVAHRVGTMTYGGGDAVVTRSCLTSFTASPSGVLTDWSYEGTGC